MEQYREGYQQKYNKETAQIHAPLDLIERTKAAVREEESRLQREQKTAPSSFRVRKWAYPLTAAAAVLILLSVSMTLKGLKSNLSEDGASGASFTESAMDEGVFFVESAEEEGIMESVAETEAGAVLESAKEMETEAALESAGVIESEEEAIMESADMGSEMAATGGLDAAAEAVMESAASGDEARSAGAASQMDSLKNAQGKLSDMKESEFAEDDQCKKQEMAADMTQVQKTELAESMADETITIEWVEKKPVFCGRSDTEKHIYEGKTFLVRKEGTAWKAYVEMEDGTGYVLRGEAGSLEEFLEEGYERLLEIE